MTQPMVEAIHVNKRYGKTPVLHDCNLALYEGECVGIIGASGSGKSTLTRLLVGLEPTTSGNVMFQGTPIETQRAQRTALQRASSIVYQQPYNALDPRMTAYASVEEPLMLRHVASEERKERVLQAFAQVDLDPSIYGSRYPMDISGGQAQRIAIARAIITRPSILLADEAMSAIDVAGRVRILDVFESIRASYTHMAMLMVSHDLGIVRHIADRIVVIHDGRIVETGETATILSNPQHEYTRSLIEAATWE